ncbi:BC023488 protein, putative [Brugia malayi]|uniref:BC023488 protein, putative n=2 Tax=Brugia malayi TaxID=6279 RepID=A0A0J9XQM6_BRUMA|nr:BC023488 protein, putative [Brugia malayi]CDP93285.2 Bm3275 [Brugia malayi]VIO92018.1 BC023488 protein, putative [Brugia malayi]
MYSNNVWFMDDRHLKSFWNYHRAALRWFNAHQAAREYAVNGSSDMININKTARTSNNDSLSDERQGSSSGDMGEDIDMSSEMAAFFRQTIEHRKQRDADRSKEAKRYKEDSCITEDHYVMADKIGVYGNEKRSFQLPNGPAERLKKFDKMKELYGNDAEKILAMEAHLDLRFEQNYSQPGAHLWPNIPLKLS